jgi:riboflavin biosynthesis pyrimidine reductase
VFHGLRERVDAVLAGTMTLRVERYGRLVKDPERRRGRVERGHAPEPLACIVTLTGDVPMDIPLLSEPEARVVIFTPRPIEPLPAAQTEVVELDAGELTLTTVMRRLRSHHGVASLLCEGGPTLFAALLHEQLVDELFVTVAPKLAGGGHGPTIANGPELPEPAGARVVWALEHGGSLFLRYAVL